MSQASQPTLIQGSWSMPYPMMGLTGCENGKHVLSCGGGGAAGKKEIPNEVHLHLYDQDLGRFTTIDRKNMGAVLPTNVTYSHQQDLWCVSAGPKGYVIEVKDDGGGMNVLHEFSSEYKMQEMGKKFGWKSAIIRSNTRKMHVFVDLICYGFLVFF